MRYFVGSDDSGFYPYSTVVYIEAYFANGSTSSGSGVVVGVNDVLTASHIVYDEFGNLATEINVYPGKDGFSEPYGYYSGSWWNGYTIHGGSSGRLYESESQYDFGIIGFEDKIGNETGWMGIGYNIGDGYFNISGYPSGNFNFFGGRMTNENNYASWSRFYETWDISKFFIEPGASGGPLWFYGSKGPYVAGIVSTAKWAADISATDNYNILIDWINGNDFLIENQTEHNEKLIETLQQYYKAILRDDAYPEEIEWAVEEIETGRMTLEELREDLINAPWTQAYVKPVLLTYEAVYGRAPDSGGLDFWVHQYRDFYELNDPSNPNVKEGLVQLLKPFVNPAQTAEFVDRYGANPSAGEFVGAAYANVLNRVPDQGGLDYWTQVYEINHAQIAAANPWMSWANVAVEARALILEQFVSSPEYEAATADAVNVFLHGAALGDTSVYSGSLWDLASHVAMMDAGEMVPAIEGSADIFWLDSMSWDISDTDRKEPAAALENPWPHPTLLGLPTDQNDGSMAV